MKVLEHKFAAKIMEECYDSEQRGFVLKKLLDKAHITYDPTDEICLFAHYNKETNRLTGYPLSQEAPGITLGTFLEYWDKYLKDPVKNTVFFNWTYKYKSRRAVRTSTTSKKGRIYYTYKYAITKYQLPESTVVDHLDLYLTTSSNFIRHFIIYLTARTKFVTPSVDIKFYNMHIKEM